jgi:hypothetical protein
MNFTQPEIEKEISNVVPHGSRENIARRTGIYPSVVSGWFNPDDERKSPHFTTLLVQNDLDNNEPEVGEQVWQTICRLREAGQPAQLHLSTSELPSLLLTKIRGCGVAIQEASTAIADGKIDKREAERLITVGTQLKADLDLCLEGLHQLLGELASGNSLRKVS